MKRGLLVLIAVMLGLVVTGAPRPSRKADGPLGRVTFTGPLIHARVTMVAAWEFPKNPLTDESLNDDSKLSKEIRWGFQLFTSTPAEAPQFVPGKITCNNCHLNGGQRDRALPLVGIAGMFPEYNRRSGRMYTLNDRIVDCFFRSQNATGVSGAAKDGSHLPTTESKEVLALNAYITWLARGYQMGKNPTWRGKNSIPADKQIPLDKLDPQKGEALFMERCINCHGMDGQGVAIGDKK